MRLQKLRDILAEKQLDAILITDPINRRYLSGFTGSAGALVITPSQAFLVTDFRYWSQAAQQAPDFELIKLGPSASYVKETLYELLGRLGAQRIGFESTNITYDQYEEWFAPAEGVEFVPTKGIVEGLRAVKDADEIALIKRAIAISDAAYAHIKTFIKPGMTEREVAWELECFIRTHGADATSFPLIVASGPNGAMPHAVTSERVIRKGDAVVIDMGAMVNGYCSDLTRTLYLGEPDQKFREVYDLVLRAQLAAEKGIRPGMKGAEADAIARTIIAEAGYVEQFGHGLGHGVGMAVHEMPGLGQQSENILEPGAIITVEPGLYIPEWGGVRIEDMVCVTSDGVEVLTKADKDPAI